jgi:predicted nucleotidyltransferase
MLTQSQKEELGAVCKRYHILAFFLFGSRAKNKAKATSDWDLAFYSKKELSPSQYLSFHEACMKFFNTEKIDLVDLRFRADPLVAFEILKTGISLYENYEGLVSELRGSAWLDFLDVKENYERSEKMTQKRLQKVMHS